jgi:RNA polymerase sigma-70 factor (ECF subfamily)
MIRTEERVIRGRRNGSGGEQETGGYGMLVQMVIDGLDVPEDGSARDSAADLLVRVAGGDQRAFAELYDLLSPRVFSLILRVLVNRAQSEEVLQEVFLEIWQSAARFAPNRGQGRSWVLTIAHRRAVDRVRASQSSTDRDVRVGVRDYADARNVVEEAVEGRLEGTRVVTALSGLPEAQQEALILAYYGGYSQSEIAAMIGAPLGTVKTRMRDGLTRLRSELGVST